MGRTLDVTVNFLPNGVLFYLLGRRFRDHRTGLGLGVALGLVSAAVTMAVDSGTDVPGVPE
jgi:hypothetical protein